MHAIYLTLQLWVEAKMIQTTRKYKVRQKNQLRLDHFDNFQINQFKIEKNITEEGAKNVVHHKKIFGEVTKIDNSRTIIPKKILQLSL